LNECNLAGTAELDQALALTRLHVPVRRPTQNIYAELQAFKNPDNDY
jgi:hypothetical protein